MKKYISFLLAAAMLLSMAGCVYVADSNPPTPSWPTEPTGPIEWSDAIEDIFGTWVFHYYGEYNYQYDEVEFPDTKILKLCFYEDGNGYIVLSNGQESYLKWQFLKEEDVGIYIQVEAAAFPEELGAIRMWYITNSGRDEYRHLVWYLDDEFYLSMKKGAATAGPDESLVWTDTADDIPGTWEHAYYYDHFALQQDNELICYDRDDPDFHPLDFAQIQELHFGADGTGYIITMSGEKSSLIWWVSSTTKEHLWIRFKAEGYMSSRDYFSIHLNIDSSSKLYHTIGRDVDDCYSAAMQKVEDIDASEP